MIVRGVAQVDDTYKEPRPHILVVDDNDELRETIADVLSFEGFSVSTVTNGQMALTWLRDRPRSRCVVLLDFMMPVMNGRAFLAVRSKDAELLRFPVILMTAAGEVEELNKLPHVFACISKTFELPRLLAIIEVAARAYETSRATRDAGESMGRG